MPEVSIIIRSKNEEKWISACLEGVFNQDFKDFEVILVDNASTDRTVEKAKAFDLKIVQYDDDFFPGKAINLGIKEAKGRYLAILSAHCIPVNRQWLGSLRANLDDGVVAGVYGRQEPLPYTNELDKRDLINLFGLDRRVQEKDSFFHNANSMIKREVWEEYPFDEKVRHIEDRVWAQKILAEGYRIVYEPEASVLHYHGINQGRNVERARRIVNILEEIHRPPVQRYTPPGLEICAILPVRSPVLTMNGQPLLTRTIRNAQASGHITRVVVAGDNDEHQLVARENDVEYIYRPQRLSYDFISLVNVYQFVLQQFEQEGYNPDLLVLLEEGFPFRPDWLVDSMLDAMLQGDLDSVFAANREKASLWRLETDELVSIIEESNTPSQMRKPLYKSLLGLGLVTLPRVIQSGNKLGRKVGMIQVDSKLDALSIRKEEDIKLAEILENGLNKVC